MQSDSKVHPRGSFYSLAFILSVALVLPLYVRSDQIEMQNGDLYNGKVISLTNDVMVLQSEILGKIAIPRTRITKISMGTATNLTTGSHLTTASTNAPSVSTNSAENALASLRQSGGGTEAEKVKQQLLGDADPAAKARFDEMLGDLLSGKMTVSDLRVQAKSAADQLRALKKQLGPEADSTLDGYLSVLENFLKEVPANESLPAKTLPALPKAPSPEKEE